MAKPTTWQKKPTEALLENDLDQLFKVFKELADSVNSILDIASSALAGSKAFLTDTINPLLLAIQFILDQMLNVINNLRNTGVHIISLYPSEEVHSLWRRNQTEKILLRDVLPGFSPEDTTGFYLLNRDDTLGKFVESFDDESDPDRPSPDENVVSGGVVIFAGALASSTLTAGSLVEETFNTFKTIAELFNKLFSIQSFEKLFEDMSLLLDKIADAKFAAREGDNTTPVLKTPKAPNWKSVKLVRDVIPSLGDLLNDVEGIVQGLKDQTTGAASIIQLLIDFIDSKIAEIQAISDRIDEFLDYIDEINNTIDRLGKFELASLVVEPQKNGVNILKSAVADDTLPNRPDQDLFYCGLVGIVGAGTGFSFLLYLLGLSDTFEIGTDDIDFSEDNLRSKYGIN